MSVFESPTSVLTNSLMLSFDPVNNFSYIGTGVNLYDISPNQFVATLDNVVLNNTVGNLGVLSFNGVQGTYINGPSFASFATAQNITFDGWYYLNGLNTVSLFSSHVGITTLFAVVQQLGTLYSKNNGGIYNLNTPIYANNWINICITYSSLGLGASAYINGTYINNFPAGIVTGNTGGATYIIGHNGLNSTFEILNGYLGLLSIYNATLTPSQIQQNFNSFRSRFGL